MGTAALWANKLMKLSKKNSQSQVCKESSQKGSANFCRRREAATSEFAFDFSYSELLHLSFFVFVSYPF